MRVVLVALLVLLSAAATVNAAPPRMQLLLEETGWFLTDGERYAAYGERNGTSVAVIDTETGARASWPIPPGCQRDAELPPRAMAAGQLRVYCESGATFLLDVTTGALRPLDFYPRGLGSHWAHIGRTSCAPPTTAGETFVNWRTGERAVRCKHEDDSYFFDLDDPALRAVCPYATHGIFRHGYESRVFDRPWLVRSVFSGAGSWTSLVPCGRRARKLYREPTGASISAGLVAWAAGADRAYAYRVRSRERRVWRVPEVRNKVAEEYGAGHSVLTTKKTVFALRPVDQACGKICSYLSWRVWRARAPR